MILKKILTAFALSFFTLLGMAQSTKKIRFFQTDWGRSVSWDTFCERTKASGYDGLETWFPNNEKDQKELKAALEKYDLLVGFLNGTNKSIPFEESLAAYTNNFEKIAAWKPAYINCHTGNDFYSFKENQAFIDAANKAAKKYSVPVYHETHRGRFSFNMVDTKKYLKSIPELKLNLDISHWMVVHESLLTAQEDKLEEVMERTHHIHARVGHAEGPQVSDPQAPEWRKAVDRHLDIWEKIIRNKWKSQDTFTVTTEFGPPDYMPTLPYSHLPVTHQWKANVYMMQALKQRLNLE